MTTSVTTKGVAYSADNVPIHYRVSGNGRVALVFVHGWCGEQGHWEEQVPAFSTKYTVVTIDVGGHGISGNNRTEWTIEAFAEDIAAVVRQLQLDRVVLIGHSLGGSMVAEATALLSDVIVAVVGIDTWSGLEVEASTQTDEDQEQRLAAFETDFRGYVEPWLRRMFHPSSDPQLVDRIVKDMVSRDQRMGLSAMKYAGTHTAKFQQRMRALRVPAYLIAADGSLYPKDPAAAGRYGIGFEMMTGVGHFPMLEAPQRFNARLDSVLDNLLS